MTDEQIERKLWNKTDRGWTAFLLGLFLVSFLLMAKRLQSLEDRVFTLERMFPPAIEFKESDDGRRN